MLLHGSENVFNVMPWLDHAIKTIYSSQFYWIPWSSHGMTSKRIGSPLLARDDIGI
ncbi:MULTISPECIES: hypothetical protein [Rickettsia]|uniref:hypothetical protein n=1 Tax=Rickettsia TaxID=780 RepID=UPI001E5B9779|nr:MULTISPECIES: hypothetical protein [Rickettsia]